jgi:hypothetical protein
MIGTDATHPQAPQSGAAPGCLLAALRYAARGWRVVPLHWVDAGGACSCGKPRCKSVGKHPLTEHGLADGTADAATVRSWWRRWPRANVGVCTGPESGVWMLGPDGPAGLDALAELERRHGALPMTPRQRSGGGGAHLIFAWPDGGKVRNSANRLGTPIDVRGEGGYFVAAPSVNGKGGYAWEVPLDEAEPQPAPGWLLAWVRRRPDREGPGAAKAAAPSERELAAEALAHLSPDRARNYQDWVAVGMALHATDAGLLPEWDRWSRLCPEKHEEGACARKWASFDGRGRSLASLIHWAGQDTGWRPPRAPSGPAPGAPEQDATQLLLADMDVLSRRPDLALTLARILRDAEREEAERARVP